MTIQGLVTSSVTDHSIPHRPFPICFFRQFFGKTHRLATQVTDATPRCDHTYDMYVIFSDNVRTVRMRYFAVRWPHYVTKIN